MKTILLLSTYPIVAPRHGGQVRLASLAKAYAEDGWRVTQIAVYEEEAYPLGKLGPTDVPFPLDTPYRQFRGRHVPLITDLLTSHYAAADDGGFGKILDRLPATLDVIHVEQIWLWPAAHKIKATRFPDARIVMGSANIERSLKEEILKTYKVEDVGDVLDEIAALEQRSAAESDLTLAVTPDDLAVLGRLGARNLLLVPNGIAPWQASEDALEAWRAKLPDAPWLLYVASAHPPNFTDFNFYFGSSLGCIPPDSRLVVVGSVCEHIYREVVNTRWGSLNLSRLQLLFEVSDADLAALKTLAHMFVLPISVGGGSNIKTAEAIYSGAHVVGGATAFRGYEALTELPEITAARTSAEFTAAVRQGLARPRLPYGTGGRRETVTWAHNTRELIGHVRAFAE